MTFWELMRWMRENDPQLAVEELERIGWGKENAKLWVNRPPHPAMEVTLQT